MGIAIRPQKTACRLTKFGLMGALDIARGMGAYHPYVWLTAVYISFCAMQMKLFTKDIAINAKRFTFNTFARMKKL